MIDDPLDPRVVEAYWVGNGLLDCVRSQDLARHVEDRFRRPPRTDLASRRRLCRGRRSRRTTRSTSSPSTPGSGSCGRASSTSRSVSSTSCRTTPALVEAVGRQTGRASSPGRSSGTAGRSLGAVGPPARAVAGRRARARRRRAAGRLGLAPLGLRLRPPHTDDDAVPRTRHAPGARRGERHSRDPRVAGLAAVGVELGRARARGRPIAGSAGRGWSSEVRLVRSDAGRSGSAIFN